MFTPTSVAPPALDRGMVEHRFVVVFARDDDVLFQTP